MVTNSKRFLVLLFTLALPFCASFAALAEQAVARLQSVAVVAGPEILLGEIAEIDACDELLRERLLNLPVGKAALPGSERSLFVGSVRVRLRQAGIPENAVLLHADTDELRVQTAATLISSSELESFAKEAVTRWLQERYGCLPATITCSVSGAPIAVTDNDYDLRLAGEIVHKSHDERLSVPVVIWSGGHPTAQVSVNCTVSAYAEVAVAATRLERHRPLTSELICWEEQNLFSVPGEALLSAAGEISPEWRLTRFADAGTVLTKEMLERVPDVFAGAEVEVVASSGAVRVADRGRLLHDGYLDSPVEVANTRTGTVVRGLLLTPVLVIVEVSGSG